MIDIHCHILPGVDDGSPSVAMSVAMARAYVEDGVHTVVSTSHFCHAHRVGRKLVRRKLDALQEELARRSIPLKLLPGNEVRLESTRFFYDALERNEFYFLGGDQRAFLLMEQSWGSYNPDTPGIVSDLMAAGTRPIIAHPERQHFFREQPSLLDELIELGAWTQVNVGSLLGENGPEAQKFALKLVDRGIAHTIGSDAHNLRRRPNLSHGFRAIEKRAGTLAMLEVHERMSNIAEALAN